MKDLSPLSYFLGISVIKHTRSIFMSQKKHVEENIERAGMASCKPSATLVDTQVEHIVSFCNPYHDPSEYSRLVGALQYLTITRLCISYVTLQMCLFMHDIKTKHMFAFDIFRVLLILVSIYILPPFISSSHILMQIGMNV